MYQYLPIKNIFREREKIITLEDDYFRNMTTGIPEIHNLSMFKISNTDTILNT